MNADDGEGELLGVLLPKDTILCCAMEQPHFFDEEAIVVWKLDRDQGYRAGGLVEWEMRPLGEVAAKIKFNVEALTFATLVESDDIEIDGRMLPTEEGRLRVESEQPMAVQFFGDKQPQSASSGIDVPYGTVVRVGPLQLALLYAEHAEALREGSSTLPEVDRAFADIRPQPKEGDMAPGRPVTARDVFERMPRWVLLLLGLGFLIWAGLLAKDVWIVFIRLPSVGVEQQVYSGPHVSSSGLILSRSVEVDGRAYKCGPAVPDPRWRQYIAVYDPEDPSRCRPRELVGRFSDWEWYFHGVFLGALLVVLALFIGRAVRLAKIEVG
jgi:hypothetical protein